MSSLCVWPMLSLSTVLLPRIPECWITGNAPSVLVIQKGLSETHIRHACNLRGRGRRNSLGFIARSHLRNKRAHVSQLTRAIATPLCMCLWHLRNDQVWMFARVSTGVCHIFACICTCRWRPEVDRFTSILLFSVIVFHSAWNFGLVRLVSQWALAACLLICPSPSAETADMCLAGFSHGWWGSGLSHPLVPKSVLFKDDNQVLRTLHSIPPPYISYFSHNTASPFPPHLVPFLRTFLSWTCLYSLLGPKVTRFLRD